MQVSSLTVPKDRRSLMPSDDTILILPGLLAVFDGATSPQRLKPGVSSGRLASQAAAQAIAALAETDELLSLPSGQIFDAINRRIREDSLREQMEGKPSTTMALAVIGAEEVRLLVHGDSGIRVNGTRLIANPKIIDDVSTRNRLVIRALIAACNSDPDEIERLTRQVLFGGYRQAEESGLLPAADLAAARQAVLSHFGQVDDPAAIVEFLDLGLHRQYQFANRKDHPLGFSTLNGDATVMPDFIDDRLPRDQVDCLEIFSDGYFLLPEGADIDAWEAAFDRSEAEDFEKLDRFAGVKGSTSDAFADDRSVIVAKYLNGRPAAM